MSLAVPVTENDHSIGPTDARVTVVNYGDYQCPNCHGRHREVRRLIDQLSGHVRFVHRHFPLINVHPRALQAAEAAEAAAAQNKFWEMHQHLYSRPDKLEDRHLRRYAHAIGLDLDRFDHEIREGVYRDQILKDYRNSLIYGITGTPTTFLNGELYAMSGADLFDVVKELAER